MLDHQNNFVGILKIIKNVDILATSLNLFYIIILISLIKI